MKYKRGFTLVELLVAIAIFAALSALGWKVFDYLIKVKERNSIHEQNLARLQEAYQQILRDSLQLIPLTANNGGELRPALELNDQHFIFSKAGVNDPLGQGLGPYERIEYQYSSTDQKLYRLKYQDLNTSTAIQPHSSVLLDQVEQYRISVLNPAELNRWPEGVLDPASQSEQLKILPRGFKINLTINGTEYEWIYSLLNAGDLKGKTINPS